METGERLAAYLAGELDADETRALEAELAREPRLRARLEALRATDAALASLPPVELPAGFPARLRAAVQAELDDQLPAESDELAARRARRSRRGTAATRSWWPQVAVAAAVLAVAGIGIGIAQLTSAGGGADMATEESGDAMIAMTTEEAAAGPTVVAAGRSFDAENLPELAADERFDEVVSQELAGEGAAEAAQEFGTAMQDDGAAGEDSARATAEQEERADAPAAAGGDGGDASSFALRTVGEVSEADLEAVRSCLPSLLEAQSAVIPVYAEIVTFDGQDAIVYGLVGNDPEQDSYRRVELWVVGRGDCQVLHFTQVDR